MSAHTPGELKADGTVVLFAGNAGGFDIRDCPQPEENAKRLVACWNAFEGYPIEAITSLVEIGGVRRLHDYSATQKENVDVLVKVLAKATGGEA